ncbi:cell division protein FtsX [Bacteroidia bacterium]|nr:cell division protein FtsX [Bacteroidia bacterium]GHT57040.1 cell division protein FtsX [Bacteroidia bacterium]
MSKKRKKINVSRLFNAHFTSIISISLVLFLIGMMSLLLLLAKDLSVYVKENISFSVILNQDVKDIEIKRLQKNLDAAPYVKSTEYINKEQAIKELSEELGENPAEFLGYNPLLASLEVKLHSAYANNDSIRLIEADMKKFPQIKEVIYQKNLIQAVNENVSRISLILFGLVGILLFISFALINNTIRLTIYSKRFLINTMKLVGANWRFIRRPFVQRNIVNGIIAAFLAMALITGLIYYIQGEIHDIISFDNVSNLLIIYGIILVLGILITQISAHFSVNKYLKMNVGDLYYI